MKRRAASTYRAARRNAATRGPRPNLQGPFPYEAPAATTFFWYAMRIIRKLGKEFRNMRVGERG